MSAKKSGRGAKRRHGIKSAAVSVGLSATVALSLSGCAGQSLFGGSTAAKPSSAGLSGPANSPSALSKASSAVADAFRIEPKVVPAPDATSLASTPGNLGPEIYLAAAQLHEKNGNSQGAVEQYQKALKASPKSLDALVGLARLHDRERRFEAANELYRRAVAAHPKSATVRNDLGLCLKRQGQIDAAVESLERAVEIEPRKTIYRNNLARVLVAQGRDDDALAHLSAVHEAPIAHYNLGYLINEAERPEQAAAHLHEAIALRPSFSQAEQLLATIEGGSPAVAEAPESAPRDSEESPVQTVAVSNPRHAPAPPANHDRSHGPAAWSLSDDTIVKRTPKIDGEENSLALEMPQPPRIEEGSDEPAPSPEQYQYQFGYGRVSHLPPVEGETR